jgi:hypothetical protein
MGNRPVALLDCDDAYLSTEDLIVWPAGMRFGRSVGSLLQMRLIIGHVMKEALGYSQGKLPFPE